MTMRPSDKNDPYRDLKEHFLIRLFRNLFQLSLLIFHFLFALVFILVPIYAYKEIFWESLLSVLRENPMPQGKNFGDLIFGTLFFLPFFAAGIFMFVLGLRDLVKFISPSSLVEVHLKKQKHKRQKETKTQNRSSEMTIGKQLQPRKLLVAFDKTTQSDSSIEYTSKNYFLTGAIVLGLIAVLWNGILSAAFLDLNLNHLLGLVFLVFLIPFFLIGAALLGITLYCVFMSFLPVFRFRIKPGEPSLGQEIEYAWSFDKPPQIIKFISIWVEATLIEIEKNDPDSVTKRSSLYRKFLVERGNPLSYGQNLSFTFPDQLPVPSTNNLTQVIWSIRVRGICLSKIGYNLVLPIEVKT